ncbi:MAG: carboxylesterase family protein [Candidatus Brevundimonas colombiensis]|uniref:Carboxylic ester hydrolase n=1 Tax=Candidatus Brevundimonas colombiensis TaxID=3121376 RepID=A0AAJ5X5N0_9CAUL|nr:carboxylesterase family protein [Brevundimonas sp.]WEK41462.1 MAG: carboxylesterase family protein [Brevundimonas sp.]
MATTDGQVAGAVADGVASWKGIPFAQPPVGALRWRAPQAPAPWSNVRPATAYSHDCMQIPFAGDAAPLGTPPTEDCLYLNVWRPAAAAANAKLPVIVWIYGGGWVNGGASPAVYDGSPLAREGVVVVSFNYRLGRFGFFAHPALTAENADAGLLGNYGYMDQVSALKWVNANIAAFGGDPANVTIMGESAGGGSVLNLMTTPLAEGLFQRAIAMSAPARMDATMKPLHADNGPDAEDDGVGFANWAGVTGEDAAALAALRALPADKVVAGTGMAERPVAPASGPMRDGRVIVGASQAFRDLRQAHVPLMVGATSRDIGFGPPTSREQLYAQFPDPAAARAAYDGITDDTAFRQAVYSDMFMVEPARFAAQQQTRLGQPAWHYRYGYVAETMRAEWPGTPHATEIPFFMGTIKARYPDKVTPADQAASALIVGYVVNFARTGNPNGTGLPQWPVYEDGGRPVMNFTNTGVRGGQDPWRARLDITQAAAERPSAP